MVMAFIPCLIETFGSLFIKLYAVANSSPEAFESCDVGFVWDYDTITLGIFGVLSFCNGLSGISGIFCEGPADMDRSLTAGQWCLLAGVAVVFAVILNFMLLVPANVIVWFGTPVEAVIFYSEFFDDDFSTCASGQDLRSIELAVVFYKIESFVAMVVVLILSLMCLTFCYLAAVYPTYLDKLMGTSYETNETNNQPVAP